MKNIIYQGLIVILLVMTIWAFKSLPGWIIEREMKRQIAGLEPVPPSPITNVRPPEPSEESAEYHRVPQMPTISPDQVYDTLKFIKDPEIPVNVVDLGLIHNVTRDRRGITITMILTTRFCPYQGSLVSSVREAVEKVARGTRVEVIIDYSTTWSLSNLTADGVKAWEQFFGNGDKKE